MPKKVEKKLKQKAREKFGDTTSKRARRYIWGALRNMGWRPNNEKD